MTDRPLTTGEGNTAERCEDIRDLCVKWMTVPNLPDNAIPASPDDVMWLLAECVRLREQLDAARQAQRDALLLLGQASGSESLSRAKGVLRDALRGVSNAYGCFAGCTGSLPGAPTDGSGHTPACRAARAALGVEGPAAGDGQP